MDLHDGFHDNRFTWVLAACLVLLSYATREVRLIAQWCAEQETADDVDTLQGTGVAGRTRKRSSILRCTLICCLNQPVLCTCPSCACCGLRNSATHAPAVA